jgi:hypothetical protein
MFVPAIRAMNGNRGRMIVQAGHAYVHALWDAQDRFPEAVAVYRSQPAFKICLAVDSRYHDICGVSVVQETGSKVSGEVDQKNALMTTALGIGPIHIDQISNDLSSLKSFV